MICTHIDYAELLRILGALLVSAKLEIGPHSLFDMSAARKLGCGVSISDKVGSLVVLSSRLAVPYVPS
jgi:hypothetical protein